MVRWAFIRLKRWQQLEVLHRNGTLLLEVERMGLILRLFSVSDFYVELYCVPSDGTIIMLNAFTEVNDLEPYLDEIDISGLIHE
jgi:hypothetical protein